MNMLLKVGCGPWVGLLVLMVTATAAAADGKAVYESTCKLCHGAGMANAPKVGDQAAWVPRIAKGMATLETHAIKGFRDKGVMPPKGGKMSLSDEEVIAAVHYMVEASQ